MPMPHFFLMRIPAYWPYLRMYAQPWESYPGPTPIRGELATIIVSVGLKKLVAIRHYIQVG